MRDLLAVVLVVASALAGCLGDADTAPPGGPSGAAPLGRLPDGSPVPTAYDLTSCAMPTGVLPIRRDVVEPLLPEGFRVPPYAGDASGNTATLIAAVKSCDPFRGEAMREFVALVIVQPPDALAGPEGTGHYLMLSWVTTSPSVVAIAEAWGAGPVVRLGDVALDVEDVPGVGIVGSGVASHGGDRFELQVSAGGEPAFNAARLRAFVVQDREVVAIAEEDHNMTWYTPGEATLRSEGPGLGGAIGPAVSGLSAYVLPEGDVQHFRYVPVRDAAGGSG